MRARLCSSLHPPLLLNSGVCLFWELLSSCFPCAGVGERDRILTSLFPHPGEGVIFHTCFFLFFWGYQWNSSGLYLYTYHILCSRHIELEGVTGSPSPDPCVSKRMHRNINSDITLALVTWPLWRVLWGVPLILLQTLLAWEVRHY